MFVLLFLILLGAGCSPLPQRQTVPTAPVVLSSPCERGATNPVFRDPERATRRKVIVSDLHLGPGVADARFAGLEDFFFAAEWEAFLRRIAAAGPTDLIVAGDFLEFWQVLGALDLLPPRDSPLQKGAPTLLGATEEGALQALRVIVAAHGPELAETGRFLRSGDHRLIVIPGNHDADLLWPRVQGALRAALGVSDPSRAMILNHVAYRHGAVHVEHGHRFDGANRFDGGAAPFGRDATGACRLQTNWGQIFVASFFNDSERRFPFVDNLYPEGAATLWAAKDEPDKVAVADTLGRLIQLLVRKESRSFNLSMLFGALGGLLGLPAAEERPPGGLRAELGENLLDRFGGDDRVVDAVGRLLSEPSLQRLSETLLRAGRAPDRPRALAALGTLSTDDLESLRTVVLGDPLGSAARRLLRDDLHLRTVIFGHSHLPGGAVEPMGARGAYANSGAWIPVALVRDLQARGVRWTDLRSEDRRHFPARFPAVVIDYDGASPGPPRLLFSP